MKPTQLGMSVVLWCCIRTILSYRISMQFPFLNSIESLFSPRLALARPLSPATRRPWRTILSPDSARRSLRPLVCIPAYRLSHPLSMHPLWRRLRQSFRVHSNCATSFDFAKECTPHDSRF